MKWLAPLILTLTAAGAHVAGHHHPRRVVRQHHTNIYYPTLGRSYASPGASKSTSPAVQMVPLPPRDTTNTTPANLQPLPHRPVKVSGTIVLPRPHTVITHPYRRPPGVLLPVIQRRSGSSGRRERPSYYYHRRAYRHDRYVRRRSVTRPVARYRTPNT